MISTVAFDADDTLWHNERFFRLTQERFAELLAAHVDGDHLIDRLIEAERRNLDHYGYGIKGFVLSMIETAIEVTEGRVDASVISDLLAAGREMLRHPIELLPHAEATVRALAEDYRIVLITKGDLLDQERKLAQSGLGDFFDAVEIVSEKTTATYQTLFRTHGQEPDDIVMVGNSLKSDVLPVLESGGFAIWVPHDMTWVLEQADPPTGHPRYSEARDMGAVPDIVRSF